MAASAKSQLWEQICPYLLYMLGLTVFCIASSGGFVDAVAHSTFAALSERSHILVPAYKMFRDHKGMID